MKNTVRQIDVIDESVDMTVLENSEYLGSVRIPLKVAVTKGLVHGTFALMDENRT